MSLVPIMPYRTTHPRGCSIRRDRPPAHRAICSCCPRFSAAQPILVAPAHWPWYGWDSRESIQLTVQMEQAMSDTDDLNPGQSFLQASRNQQVFASAEVVIQQCLPATERQQPLVFGM